MGRVNMHLNEIVVNELYELKKKTNKSYTDILLQIIGIYMSELEGEENG